MLSSLAAIRRGAVATTVLSQGARTVATPLVFRESDSVVVVPRRADAESERTLAMRSLRRATSVTTSLNGAMQIRQAHTDLRVPDFSYYRRPTSKDATTRYEDSAANRKLFTYVVTGAMGVSVAYMAKNVVRGFVSMLAPAKDVIALASIEVDLAEIPEGKSATFTWRGKPLFVRHRLPAEIDDAQKTAVTELRDPQPDSDRVKNADFLIVVGICTHLGCVPIANAGSFVGGYYCPCHGSHYDSSGRIRKGPAPLNLEVPPYEYISDSVIKVG